MTDTPDEPEMDTPLLDDLFEADDTEDTLSDSDEVYLSFRQVVDPGLMNANFDLAPGKSSAFHSRQDGTRFVDQPLRSHILNGAAFGARLNHALRELNSPAALTDDQLLEVLAMFACHDLHKSEDAQRRRANADDAEEYDIPDNEIKHYIDKLRLNELDTDVEFRDYKASALRTEEGTGRHRTVSSMRFTAHSDWIRLLDAAAALSKPNNIDRLERRLTNLTGDVELAYHRLDDTKGITTNLLNAALADYITDETTAETVVYFHDGVLYLTPTGDDIHADLTSIDGSDLMRDMADHYVDHLHDEVDTFADLDQVKNALAGKWGYGYIAVGRSAYLLYGLDRTEEAMRAMVEDKATYTDWNAYSAYKKATISALDNDIIGTDALPDTHHKTQALGLYLGAIEKEVFRRLRYNDTVGPVLDVVDALDLPNVKSYFETLTGGETWPDCTPSLTDTEFNAVQNHLDETENNLNGIITDGYKLTQAKTWSHVVAHAFLNSTRDDGTRRRDLPFSDVLADASDALLGELYNWNGDWDDTIRGDWDASLSADEKVERFKTRLLGPFHPSTRDYIARFVSVNGKQLAEPETDKTKLDEAAKNTQPHICGLCRDLLIGGTSLERDFRTSEDVVGVPLGFTHMKGISASGNEPKPVVCAQCDLETTLRNSIHSLDKDDTHNYLYISPDYYYSPADMAVQARIRRQFKADSGFTLLQVAKEILSGDASKRADSIERVLEAFKTDEDYREYNEFIHNYDAAISDVNSMGVYRLEAPSGITSEMDDGEQAARIARWLLDTMFSVVVSWATSSRVLLTPSPLPTTDFNDFPEMVKLENAPGPVTEFLGGDTISISRLGDLGKEPDAFEFKNLTAPSVETTPENALTARANRGESGAIPAPTATDGGAQARLVQLNSASDDCQAGLDDTETLTLNTELGTTLYKLSSVLYLTQRRFGVDVRKLSTTLDKTNQPFPAASMLLKGNTTMVDYSALSAASILDTLTDYTMSDRIQKLAEAGFDTLHPRKGKDSNYEYERLFRVATETVMDMGRSTSDEELKTLVAGEVMNTATRAIQNEQYAKQEYVREPAEDFAELFIDEIFNGLCDGNQFELNRKENTLASGYNAAIRRHEKAWLSAQSSD